MIRVSIYYRNHHSIHHNGVEVLEVEDVDNDQIHLELTRVKDGPAKVLIPLDIIERIEMDDVETK